MTRRKPRKPARIVTAEKLRTVVGGVDMNPLYVGSDSSADNPLYTDAQTAGDNPLYV